MRECAAVLGEGYSRYESVEDVVACCAVILTALVVWEVVLHRAHGQLLFESVDLVEEEDDAGLRKPPAVTYRVEERERLLHAVDGLVFEQQLVVLGDGDEEQNSSHILEAMDPLFPLGPLAADVEHAVRQVADDEGGLGDTGRLHTRSKYVLV